MIVFTCTTPHRSNFVKFMLMNEKPFMVVFPSKNWCHGLSWARRHLGTTTIPSRRPHDKFCFKYSVSQVDLVNRLLGYHRKERSGSVTGETAMNVLRMMAENLNQSRAIHIALVR
jgi:hypothetical protein